MSLTKVTYSMVANAPFNVKDFGAVGNGVTDDTAAIQAAIDACGAAGGGIVILPAPNVYYNSSAEIVVSDPNVTIQIQSGAKILQSVSQYGMSCIQLRANNCSVFGYIESEVNQGNQTPNDPGQKSVIFTAYEGQPGRDRASAVYVPAGIENVYIDIRVYGFVNGIKLNGTALLPIKKIQIYLNATSMDFGLLATATEGLYCQVLASETWPSQDIPPHAVYLSEGGFGVGSHKRMDVTVLDSGQTYSSSAKMVGCDSGSVRVYSGGVARGIDIATTKNLEALFIGTLVQDTNTPSDTIQSGFRIVECENISINENSSVYVEDDNDNIFGCTVSSNCKNVTVRGYYRVKRIVSGTRGIIRVDGECEKIIIKDITLQHDGILGRVIELNSCSKSLVINPIYIGVAEAQIIRVVTPSANNRIELDPFLFENGWESNSYFNTGINTELKIIEHNLVNPDVGNASVTLLAAVSNSTQIWDTPLGTNRTCNFSLVQAYNGSNFRIVRTANATGAFNLTVTSTPPRILLAGTWCDVQYDGTNWVLTGYGTL